jgi:hypothetical protein
MKTFTFLMRRVPGELRRYVLGLLLALCSTTAMAQTVLIDPAGGGGFELGSTFADNGWSESSGANNPWYLGTPANVTAPQSNRVAFISNDAGTTNAYTNTATASNFFWRDVTVPAGETKITLSFNWRNVGESSWDILQVFSAPTSVTPLGSTTYPGSGTATIPTAIAGATVLGSMQSSAATVSTATIFLPASLAGTTFRLIFYWKNDNLDGSNPPASVDNISLVSALPGNFVSIASGDWGAASTWDLNQVPTAQDNATVSVGHTVTVNAANQSINNLMVDGILTYGTGASQFDVVGNLTIAPGGGLAGYQAAIGKTLRVAGNIVNDGNLDFSVGTTTAGNLTLFGSAVQTVGGSGTWGGSANPNVIRNITCSNTSTARPNIIWNVNNINVANSLNLTGARVQLGSGYNITLGNSASAGTLTAPAGTGFLAPAVFGRFWLTSSTGTSITAGTTPTAVTGSYPFIAQNGTSRSMHIQRVGATTGNVNGMLTVSFTPGSYYGSNAFLDSIYQVTDYWGDTWQVTADASYVHNGTHSIAIQANNLYRARNGNNRIMVAGGTFVGTHQNGNNTPMAQRINLTTAALTSVNGFNLGIGSPDLCGPETQFSENFDSYATGSIVPNCWDRLIVGTASQTITSTTPASGTRNIYQYSASTANQSYVILPEMVNISTGTHRLKWKMRSSPANGILVVGYITNILDASTFVAINNYTIANTSYGAQTILNLPAGLPSNARIAVANLGATTASIYWDDMIYEPIPACPELTAPVVSAVTSSSADISFTGHATAQFYEIVVQAPGTGLPTGTGTAFTATTYTATGLSANTPYEAYIRANCGNDVSIWTGPINFRTTCLTGSMPYLMDFNVWPPDCWNLTGGTFSTTQANNSTGSPDHMRANFWSQSSGNFALATSLPININAVARARFNWSHQYSTSYPNDQLLLMGQIVGSTVWDTLVNLNGPNFNTVGSGTTTPSPVANFVLETANLPLSYTGQDVVFRFRFNSGFGPDVFVDNFRVEAIPQCTEPSGLVVSNITAYTADLNWTASSTALSYEVVVQPAGSGLPTGTGSFAASTSFSASALNAQSNYEAYVRSVCASGLLSPWTGPIPFTTACAFEPAPTAPQTFASWTGTPLPNCWEKASGALGATVTLTPNAGNWFSSTNFGNGTGTNRGTKVNLYGTQNSWLISQAIDLGTTPGIYRVSYRMAVTDWLGTVAQPTLGTHRVDVVVSPDAGATWSNVDVIRTYTGAGSYSNTGQLEFVNLSSYTGVVKIAFVATTSSTSPDIDFHLDDVSVEAIPSCPFPSSLSAAPSSASTAGLNWIAGGSETEWEVAVVLAGSPVPTSGTSVTSTNYTATGLLVGSSYSAYVRSVCSPTNISPWTTVNFTMNYCPSNATSTADSKIASVKVGGTTVTSPTGTGNCAAYTDNTALPPFTLSYGTPTSLEVQYGSCGGNYTAYATIYVDLNNDLQFDPVTELVGGGTCAAGAPYTGTALITGGPQHLGLTRLRVVLREGGSATLNQPCGTYTWGETQDYLVNLLPPANCVPPAGLTANITSASSADINWAAVTGAFAYEVVQTTGGGTPSGPGLIVTSTSTSMTGLVIGASYTFHVRAICAPGDTSVWNAVNLNFNYCASAASTTFDTKIASVSINGVVVASPVGPGNCATYTDYTSLPPFQIISGASFPVAIEHGTCGGVYGAYAKVYVDVNNDLTFDPISEMVAEGAVPGGGILSVTGNLPIGTFSGVTRLRVVLVETTLGSSVQPCGSYFYGETQDFSINILAPQPNDLGVVAVLSPNDACGLSATESITVRITNFGTATQSNFPVSYRVNNGATVTETFSGSIDFGMSANHTFAATANMTASGAYSIKSFTGLSGDATASNDTTVRVVYNIPVISGATLPYNENFENGTGGWVVGGTTTWALGAPAGIAINTPAPGGSNSWVTNLAGNYNDNENGYIESPCFDFTGVYGAEVSFDLWWNMENNWDKGVFYYSTDAGATWSILGSLGSGTNWYNLTSTFGPISGSPVWTGSTLSGVSSNGWVRAVHNLNVVDNLPSVKFRIAFLSDASVNGYDGLGFDNFRVRVPVDPIITFVSRATDSCALATRAIEAKVRHFAALTNVNLHHDMMGVGTYSATPMTYTAADSTWRATLPAGASAVMKRYFVSAQDAINLTDTSDIVRFMDDPIVISAGNDTSITVGASATLRASSVQGPSGILGDLTQSATTSCGGGFMFDITAPAAGVSITGFDVLPFNAGSQTVNVYYKSGTKNGFQTNQAAWTLEGSYTINPTAAGAATFMPISGISIPASGTVAIYLQYNNYYSSSGINFTNADLTILNGEGLCTNWQTCCTPRYWRGRIHYGSNLSLIWTDVSGTQLGTGDTLLVTPSTTTAYVLTATNGVCVKSDTVLVSISGSVQPPVSGTLRYDNTALTPMTNTTVRLLSGGVQVTSVITNASGDFNFGPVPPGAYTLQYQTNKPWGGVNSVDALNITRHFSVVQPLSGLRLRVADVNNSNTVSATDALQVNQRFSFLRSSFTAGDWAYSLNTLTVPNDPTPIVLSGRALCSGDVNGSYSPNVNLRERWEDLALSGEVFTGEGEYTVNVQLSSALNVGAVSLVLRVPAGMEVLGITTGLGSSDEVVFNQIGNVVRIAWHTLQQWDVEQGGVLLRIRARGAADGVFALGAHESELANSWADVYGSFDLRTPRLVGSSVNYTGLSVYPNPSTSIFRVSSETAMQELVVRDLSGREVMRTLPVAGATELDLSAQRDGVYMLEVRLSDRTEQIRLVLRR